MVFGVALLTTIALAIAAIFFISRRYIARRRRRGRRRRPNASTYERPPGLLRSVSTGYDEPRLSRNALRSHRQMSHLIERETMPINFFRVVDNANYVPFTRSSHAYSSE